MGRYDGAVGGGAREGPWGHGRAPTLCLVRGVYTTCVHTVFPLDVADIPDKTSSGRHREASERNQEDDTPLTCAHREEPVG
ncbi:hypothetical protein GCM10010497_63340 [Streptomyces cinereoruber]|uniref:Uncharacterized protein n=1 Tax=Streptomyces cinereoruber TaxID=67260 RepID=A0AAV4KT19_9ACTN|nr:hypothetical protein GCM10010497_63340 [Streptomyces cinereoruber]